MTPLRELLMRLLFVRILLAAAVVGLMPLDLQGQTPIASEDSLEAVTIKVTGHDGRPMDRGTVTIMTRPPQGQLPSQPDSPRSERVALELDGRATYVWVPQRPFEFLTATAEAEGLPTDRLTVRRRDAPLEIALRLAAGERLGGRVKDDRGEPVAGIRFWVYRKHPGDQNRWASHVSFETDVEGRWSLENMPTDRPLWIQVGREQRDRYVEVRPEDSEDLEALRRAEHVLVLKRGRMVRLQILDELGEPTQEVSASVLVPSQNTSYGKRVDKQGIIVAQGLTDEVVSVEIYPRDDERYFNRTVEVQTAYEDEVETTTYRLELKSSLELLVLDDQGKPLADRDVSVHGSSFPGQGFDEQVFWLDEQSDASGRVTLDGLPVEGDVVLVVTHDTVHYGRFTVPLGTGEVQTLRVVQDAPSPFLVSVIDGQERPIPNAMVRFETFDQPFHGGRTVEKVEIATDAAGQARWVPSEPHRRIIVHAEHYDPEKPRLCIMAASYMASMGSEEPITIMLRPGLTVGGVIQDDLGQPVPNLRVELRDVRGTLGTMPRLYQCFHHHTVTNSEGRWMLGPVDEKTAVGLYLRDDRFLNSGLERGLDAKGLDTRTHQITLERGRMIEAVLVNPLGQPVADQRVLLRDPEFPEPLWHPKMAMTDEEGFVRFHRLEDKTYILETDTFDENLLPERREFRPWFAGDQEPVRMVQRPRPIVVFEVVDSFGIPLEGAQLIFQVVPEEQPEEGEPVERGDREPAEVRAFSDFSWTDERGHTEMKGLPESGRLRVIIQHPEHPSEVIEIEMGQPEYRLRLGDPSREVPSDLISLAG